MRVPLFFMILCGAFWFPLSAGSAEFGEIDLAGYLLGGWPRDQHVFNQGGTAPASIQPGIGAGVKIGLFPHATRRMLGIEIDSYGHGGALSFPNTVNGQNNGTGRSNLLVLNTMLNLILRYPGESLTPYIGIGGGWSHGTLLNPNITGRADKDFDSARALGYQYLAGAQVLVSQKVFVFGEYRYFSANYHWDGLAVDFRAHYGLVGVGLRF
ncbi:MAG: outer membrane beta-barrel protein [Nitrospira sp. CR1.1]|jgi:opacity protein-like surface antigen|nr:outer membrane beta-barrel protein [Nitrospira sp. CR1.1]